MKEEAELSKRSSIKKKKKKQKENYFIYAVHIFISKLVCKNIHATCILLVQPFFS